MGWQEALRYVRSLRPVVNPNLGFQRQLMHFEYSTQLQQVLFIFLLHYSMVIRDGNGSVGQWVTASDPLTYDDEIAVQ